MKAKQKTWAQRIAAARKRGKFTPDDLEMASRWNTCAVGEAAGYPETEDMALTFTRKSPILDGGIGVKFCDAVQHHNFAAATKLLKEIKAAAKALA